MIVNFSVQNFGSIKQKVTLSFEATKSTNLEDYYIIDGPKNLRLLKLAIIYGPNGSGKSTLLESLDFLRDLVLKPATKKDELLNFEPFLMDDFSRKENSFLSLEFIKDNVKYLYDIEFNEKAIIHEDLYFYNPNKAIIFKRVTDIDGQFSSIVFGDKIKFKSKDRVLIEGNTLWNATVLGGYLKTNIQSRDLKNITDWFKDNLKAIITPKISVMSYISTKLENNEIDKNNLIKFLKKADFKIDDILIESEEQELNEELLNLLTKKFNIPDEELIKIKDKGKIDSSEIIFRHQVTINNEERTFDLPYYYQSDGTKRYYQFSGLLDFMIRNQIVLPIDEIESSLHPDLLKHFILTFLVNIKKSQLILTTHNIEILNNRDILRNDAIWFTEKKDDGSSDLYSLADFDTTIIRDTNSIYNAYKIGKLGAVPNLGDYYIDIEDGKNYK